MVILAGRNYGAGSARDWAAKGTRILGVAAVFAESFERIHRSNLVALGVLPLQFAPGEGAATLGLEGFQTIYRLDLQAVLRPEGRLQARFRKRDGTIVTAWLTCRLETAEEVADLRRGGVLPAVLEDLSTASRPAEA